MVSKIPERSDRSSAPPGLRSLTSLRAETSAVSTEWVDLPSYSTLCPEGRPQAGEVGEDGCVNWGTVGESGDPAELGAVGWTALAAPKTIGFARRRQRSALTGRR